MLDYAVFFQINFDPFQQRHADFLVSHLAATVTQGYLGFVSTFKETSLLAIIGIVDFLRVANSVIPGQTEFLGVKLEGLLFVCLIYWIGAYSMSKYSQRLEKHLGVGEH